MKEEERKKRKRQRMNICSPGGGGESIKSGKVIGQVMLSIVLVIIAAVVIGSQYYITRVRKSELYKMITPYQRKEAEWSSLRETVFKKNSAEEIFLLGMDALAHGDVQKAKELFTEALSVQGKDPALPAYLYFYLNECSYALEGVGDVKLIAQTLDAAEKYKPHTKNGYMLKRMLTTIAFNDQAEQSAREFIEDYLKDRNRLELSTWVRLKNGLGMLEYSEEKYARSIRDFYDVQIVLENKKRDQDMEGELAYAKEYIANIYYLFEDYENAIRLYQESIQSVEKESIYRFTSYSNISTASLRMGDIENAKNIVRDMESLLQEMSGSTRQEAEACINDTLALIAMKEGNYGEAKKWIALAEAGYETLEEETIFIGGKYFVRLTKCKYMIHEGELEEAGLLLENMLSDEQAMQYGLEKEIYELLLQIYQKEGNQEKEIEAYNLLLKMDNEQERVIRAGYLEFAMSYRDVQRREMENQKLRKANMVVLYAGGIFLIAIILLVWAVRMMNRRNIIDHLTGVYNRRKLEQLFSRYERFGTPGKFGVIMLDIDFFKRYNDTYGHTAGDRALKEVAKVLTSSVRNCDLVVRYGGEEFMIVLNGLDAETAKNICQRIKVRMEKRAVPHSTSEVSEYITLSMGLCYQEKAGTNSLQQLIEYADACLYQSKEKGRNTYTAAEK